MRDVGRKNWKDRLRHDFVDYWGNVKNLTLVFAAFTQYRRIVLAVHDITYTNYGFAVIEALLLGKVIMIGDALGLGHGLEQRPLIYPTLYKTIVFSCFVAAFKVIEHVIKTLWQGGEIIGDLLAFSHDGSHEVLAYSLIVFLALIPFFAVRELGRVFGGGNIRALFFRKRSER